MAQTFPESQAIEAEIRRGLYELLKGDFIEFVRGKGDQEIGEAVGFHHTTINHILNGGRVATIDQLVKMARAIGREITWHVEGLGSFRSRDDVASRLVGGHPEAEATRVISAADGFMSRAEIGVEEVVDFLNRADARDVRLQHGVPRTVPVNEVIRRAKTIHREKLMAEIEQIDAELESE